MQSHAFSFLLLLSIASAPAWAAKRKCPVYLEIIGNTETSINLDVKSEKDILKAGSLIQTPGGLKLKITKAILDGHKGMVYRATDHKGHLYAIKVPRYDLEGFDYDILKSFAKEPLKAIEFDKLDVAYARIFEYGTDYLVKEWVEGIRGDEWIKEWLKKSEKEREKDPRYLQLMQLFDHLASQRVYVGNLKAINLIHDGEDWVIVDSGTPDYNYSSSRRKNRKKYQSVFESRWVRD